MSGGKNEEAHYQARRRTPHQKKGFLGEGESWRGKRRVQVFLQQNPHSSAC